MKIKFREVRLNKKNKERLDVINSIIEKYQEMGLVLTLRQLYYQLVIRNTIPNKASEYSKLSTLLKEGRMGGIVDWDAIEDRLRKPSSPSAWDTPEELMEAATNQYQKPRMNGQETYIEVWVEKDALSGVLNRVTRPYHVPIMVNRGYSSASAMHDAFNRFRRALHSRECRRVKVLYLGDFDPSGLDMIRDIENRISEFAVGYPYGIPVWNFQIVPIALTNAQIEQYSPPPNPAKLQDPRAGGFVESHGYESWEVDALDPEVLHQILDDAIKDIIDEDKYKSILAEEKTDRKKLRKLITMFGDVEITDEDEDLDDDEEDLEDYE